MKIFLVGYMGCGKSTIGKGLAKLTNSEFVDLDTYIENHYHATISSLFNKYGESNFRLLEQSMLLEVSNLQGDIVVATGGGTPCFFDNMELMNSVGVTIYIDAPAKMLAHRLEGAKKKRPIIEGLSSDELLHFIQGALDYRLTYYQKAAYTVNGVGATANDVYNVIKLNGLL